MAPHRRFMLTCQPDTARLDFSPPPSSFPASAAGGSRATWLVPSWGSWCVSSRSDLGARGSWRADPLGQLPLRSLQPGPVTGDATGEWLALGDTGRTL